MDTTTPTFAPARQAGLSLSSTSPLRGSDFGGTEKNKASLCFSESEAARRRAATWGSDALLFPPSSPQGGAWPLEAARRGHETTPCASLALELPAQSAPARLRVIPDGTFDAVDGRPANMKGVSAKAWRLDADIAKQVIAAFAAGADLPIDYEHQTLKAAENGQPAPAAGWITALEYEAGKGLLARVRWTDAARAYLARHEYRYLSPVFSFDPNSGAVLALHSVALTNTPALGAAGEIVAMQKLSNPKEETTTMDTTKLLAALGLPQDAAVEAALQKVAGLNDQIAALKSTQFSPDKHIPLAEHQKLCAELAELKAQHEQAEHDQLMRDALDTARILPPNEAYWRAQPLAALKAFLKDAKPLAALAGTQTQGRAPAGGERGNDPASIARAALRYQTEQYAAGVDVSTADAVEHVMQQGV